MGPDRVKQGQMLAPGVNPITLADDGRLFVALDFLGDGLYELDPRLVDPPRQILPAPGWMNGMDWGPDQHLYGPIWTQGRIARVDPESGSIETAADGFNIISAVKFDSILWMRITQKLQPTSTKSRVPGKDCAPPL